MDDLIEITEGDRDALSKRYHMDDRLQYADSLVTSPSPIDMTVDKSRRVSNDMKQYPSVSSERDSTLTWRAFSLNRRRNQYALLPTMDLKCFMYLRFISTCSIDAHDMLCLRDATTARLNNERIDLFTCPTQTRM